jgi:HAE1 family hydrophobic/amphiphilic exporter-1
MNTAIRGSSAGSFRREDDRIDIRVVLNEKDRSRVDDLNRLNLNTESGLMPISPLIVTDEVRGPSKILRKNQREYIKISGNFLKMSPESVKQAGEIQRQFIRTHPAVEISGGEGEKETRESFSLLQLAFLLSVFLIFALLAVQFESLLSPFIILFTVPLSFPGAFGALLLFHKTLNLNSIIGLVMLSGIVVNNAIILIDRFNQSTRNRKTGASQAVYYGSAIRFKPVLTTTVTTVIGLVPMALVIGRGAKLQTSLALTVMGGLIVSTLLTLFLIPALYQILTKPSGRKASDG